MIPAFGTPEFRDWGERQLQALAEKGYRISSNINFDTHCFSQVTNHRGFRAGKAVLHDGSREDAQRAVDEAIYTVIEVGWEHYNMNLRPSIKRTVDNE